MRDDTLHVPNRAGSAPHATTTKARILDVASRQFAEHGFERTTIRRIAAEASVNLAAVNYHFRDKVGLYGAVVEASLAGLGPALDDAARALDAGRPPAIVIRLVVEAFLGGKDGAGDRLLLARLVAWELIRTPLTGPADEPSAAHAIERFLRDRVTRAWSDESGAIIAPWILGQCLMFALPGVAARADAADVLASLMLEGLAGWQARRDAAGAG